MKLAKLGHRVVNWKKENHDTRDLGFELCHLHSEVSECFDALRDVEKLVDEHFSLNMGLRRVWTDEDGHPQGLGTELADVVIIASYLAARIGIDLEHMIRMKMDYNEDRTIKKEFRK